MTRPAHEHELSPDHRNLAVIVSAIYGILLAVRQGIDVVGVFVVACAIAVGGGTRGDLFLDRHPLFSILNPHYPLIVLALRYLRADRSPGLLGRSSTWMECPHRDGNWIDGGSGLPLRRSSLEAIVSQPSCTIGPSLSLGIFALGQWRPRGGRRLHRKGPILGVEERKDRPRNAKGGRWLRSWSSPC